MVKSDRNELIIAEILAGETLQYVGYRYGISKARVLAIMSRAGYEKRYIKKEKDLEED